MSELPRRLSPKTALSANWLNRLLDFLRSRDLKAGPGIRLTRTPSGSTVSLVPAEAADARDTIPARIVSRNPGGAGLYNVDFFANGPTASRTGRGTVFITGLGTHQEVDRDGWILTHVVTANLDKFSQEGA